MPLPLEIILWIVVVLLVIGCVPAIFFLVAFVTSGVKDLKKYRKLKEKRQADLKATEESFNRSVKRVEERQAYTREVLDRHRNRAPEPPRKTPMPPREADDRGVPP